MSRPVDVLATLDDASMRVEAIHGPTAVYALREARAAVAELVEAARDAGLYLANMDEQNSGPAERIRAALAKFGGSL